jgi:hypothetical protein
MTKAQGPEEFFEVLRSARTKERAATAAAQAARDARQADEVRPPEQPIAKKPEPEPSPEPEVAEASPQTPSPAPTKRLPLSAFSEDEPTIAVRRSTLIFVALAVLVLLFIAFALGRRTAAKPTVSAEGPRVTERGNLTEKREPAHPARFRNKYMVYLHTLDHTQQASQANAKKYREMLQSLPAAELIAKAGKEAVIMAYDRKLFVCVGPFDALDSPDLNQLLPRLRALDVKFATASVQRLPYMAKTF